MAQQERLKELREALVAVGDPPAWSDWKKIEAWAASAHPFIVQSFPTDVARFEVLVAEPRWAQLAIHAVVDFQDEGVWRARQRVEQLENARIVNMKKGCILDFLDELARRDSPKLPVHE